MKSVNELITSMLLNSDRGLIPSTLGKKFFKKLLLRHKNDSALHCNTTFPRRPTRVQSSPGPRSTSSASSSGTTTPRPATATPAVPPAAPSRPTQPPAARQAVQLSDLQNILSNIQGEV